MMATPACETAKLDELGFVGRGKSRHRPRNAAFLYGGRYPFFQTGDIKAANFHLTEYKQTYSEEGLAQSKLWKPGTLCITIAANIAESAILGIEGCFPDSVVGFVADPDKADVRFVKYYMDTLKHPDAERLARHNAGQPEFRQAAHVRLPRSPAARATANRRHPVKLRRADREQSATHPNIGGNGPRPIPRVVRTLPLPWPR